MEPEKLIYSFKFRVLLYSSDEFCSVIKVTAISYCSFVYWLLAVYAYGDALQKL